MTSLLLSCPWLLGLVAVDPVRLLVLIWECDEAHCSFSGAAVLARSGDGVADATVSQPASVAAIKAVELPGSVYMAHLGNLCIIV